MAKKTKAKEDFPQEVIRNWEGSDGVNFAIALARITGWILHVDWWSPTDDNEKVENMKSLRVHVGNNHNDIYDLRGKHSIATYTNKIIFPLQKERGGDYGVILTRFYSEKALFDLPLRIKPDEIRIQKTQEIINNNTYFLEKIPKRQKPMVPAYIAARYTWSHCNPFATALSDLKGYKAVAIIAKEYNKLFGHSKLGYVHSFVLDNNNIAIDIWGKDSIENIALRFGITKYEIDGLEHDNVNRKLRLNSPEKSKQYIKKVFR